MRPVLLDTVTNHTFLKACLAECALCDPSTLSFVTAHLRNLTRAALLSASPIYYLS